MDEGLRTGLTGCLDGTLSLPPEVYTGDEAFRHEAQAIFGTGWIAVGRSDRWTEAGSYAALDLGGVPIVIVRNRDQQLAAFGNTCRHRGAQIMDGEGTCSMMRCPFHGWTYDLDGRLLGAPAMNQTPDFSKADHGLMTIPVEERHGFAFVSLQPAVIGSPPPDIDTWLGDFSSIHSPWPLDTLVTTRRREFTVDCNWKLFAEVFNEYYHLPYVHPGSIDSTYQEPDEAEAVAGGFATQFGATNGTGGLLEDDAAHALPTMAGLTGRPATGVRYSWLFPNVVTAVGADALWLYETYPLGPAKTHCVQVVAFPPESVAETDFEAKADSYYERFDVAIDEDIPVLERQQRGMTSPLAAQGPFSYLEPNVAAFARWYSQRMLAHR